MTKQKYWTITFLSASVCVVCLCVCLHICGHRCVGCACRDARLPSGVVPAHSSTASLASRVVLGDPLSLPQRLGLQGAAFPTGHFVWVLETQIQASVLAAEPYPWPESNDIFKFF